MRMNYMFFHLNKDLYYNLLNIVGLCFFKHYSHIDQLW